MAETNGKNSGNLYDLIYACQRGQRVAIVGGHEDEDPLREGLYVKQHEDEVVEQFFNESYEDDGQLLIITGSAGDGKSALLARGYESASADIPEERINMDATEARRRDEDYVARLTDFFHSIIKDLSEGSGPRSALAINYGLAVDYFQRRDPPEEYEFIWQAMQESQSERIHRRSNKGLTVINLSHRRTYSTKPSKLGEGLVRDVLDKFDPSSEDSPFGDAFEEESDNCPAGSDCLLHYNIRQLKQEAVKDQLARLLAGWSIVTNSYINPRSIIDAIATLLIPEELQGLPDHDSCPVGAELENGNLEPTDGALIWNAVFEAIESGNEPESAVLDPASSTDFATDQKALNWAADIDSLDERLSSLPEDTLKDPIEKVRTTLRMEYLTKANSQTILEDDSFIEFATALTFFNEYDESSETKSRTKDFLRTTKNALSNWTGTRKNSNLVEFVDGQRSADYRFLSQWSEPDIDMDRSKRESKSLAVPGRVKLMAPKPNEADSYIPIPLSFDTYRLMKRISHGYTPNSTDLDQSHAIRMLNSRLDDFTRKKKMVRIESRTGTKRIELREGDLGLNVRSEGL